MSKMVCNLILTPEIELFITQRQKNDYFEPILLTPFSEL